MMMRALLVQDYGEARAAYEAEGVVCLRSFIAKDTIARLLEAVEIYKADPRGRFQDLREDTGGRFFIANFMSQFDQAFHDFATKSALAGAAKALTGASTVRFFYDQLFAKDARTSAATPWHHDLPFWPISGDQTISMWVALKPVNADSGYLEYAAGSHRWGKLFKPIRPGNPADAAKDDGLPLPPDLDDPEVRAHQRMLRWDLEPGDVLCHHPLVIHGTEANLISTQPRYGLSVRYMGDDARWLPHPDAMPLPRDPTTGRGDYPADETLFPVVA